MRIGLLPATCVALALFCSAVPLGAQEGTPPAPEEPADDVPLADPEEVALEEPEEEVAVDDPGEEFALEDPDEVTLRPFVPARADTILLDDVVRGQAWWIQGSLGGSIYDARRDVFIGRWSPGVQVGYRFDSIGVFGSLEFDQTFDFTLETDSLQVMDFGVGMEFLSFVGHVRTSISAGVTVLMSETAIDEPGELGWYIDFRPSGLRWGIGDEFALEVTPISLDVLVPITNGIPLAVYSYMTLVGLEWSL